MRRLPDAQLMRCFADDTVLGERENPLLQAMLALAYERQFAKLTWSPSSTFDR